MTLLFISNEGWVDNNLFSNQGWLTVISISNQSRVPHISLVFREMWDTTTLDALVCGVENLQVQRSGIPHLAKNERDVAPGFDL